MKQRKRGRPRGTGISTGAVYGQLAGACYGIADIPERTSIEVRVSSRS